MKPLKKIFFDLNLPSKLKQSLLILEILQKNWNKVLEKELSSLTFPQILKDDILFIEVPNHYLLQTLSGKTETLLKKITEVLPEEFKNSIKAIRFKINPSLNHSEKKVKPDSSFSKELKVLLEFCEEIKDLELKKLFVKMFKSYVKLKNSKF